MKKEQKKLKIKRKIRIKKFRADQDPKKDKPIETIELPEEDITNARN